MGNFNSMLNIMPYNCPFGVQLFKGLEHISEEARNCGLRLIELQASEAVKEPVWNTLASQDPIFVCGGGHGWEAGYTGDIAERDKAIFTTAECSILANRVVYLHSCLTAVELGPAIIDIGALAYAGYNIEWTWMSSDLEADPYDIGAECFFRSANELPIALIQGEMMGVATQRCIAEYNRWIEIWETSSKAELGSSAETLKWLIYDRDGLTVLGNLSATVVVTGTPANITIDIAPPSSAHTGVSFTYQGKLFEEGTTNPLSGKVIKLMQAGIVEPIATTTTDEVGQWAFDISLSKGIHTIYAFFPGDDEYAGTYTRAFRIEVGITLIEVTKPPETFAGTGETVSFSGTLIDKKTGLGIPDRTIRLIVDGGTALSTTTDGNGAWTFNFTLVKDIHIVYSTFNGDTEYMGASSPEFTIDVGRTEMEMINPPPEFADVGETISFSGILIDKMTGAGILNKTVKLKAEVSAESGYVDSFSLTTITDSNGNWMFDITITTLGRYKLYVEFLGDTEFVKSKTDSYRISIGLLPIFGCDEVGGWAGCMANAIWGTVFTIPENGVVQNMVMYLEYWDSKNRPLVDCKVIAAIYQHSDLSLIAVTEEREFHISDGRFKGWRTFPLVTLPRLIANTKYILVMWQAGFAQPHFFKIEDEKPGMGQSQVEYEDFPPAVLKPIRWTDKMLNIYCEYIPEAVTIPEQTVELTPGESKQVFFEVVPSEIGTYLVTVDGLQGNFKVTG